MRSPPPEIEPVAHPRRRPPSPAAVEREAETAGHDRHRVGPEAVLRLQRSVGNLGAQAALDYPGAGVAGPRLLRQDDEAGTATATADPFAGDSFGKANSFDELIVLVETAEQRLLADGVAGSTWDVVHILRGIFYGTEWSMDFEGSGKEGSDIRNLGFMYYTKHATPEDPRPAIGQSLFDAVRRSAEVKDPSGRHTDFGHIVIGVETQTWAGKNLPTGTGGTGLEVVTWLGDIGGGAGMLAMRRGGIVGKATPDKPAIDMFPAKEDYGASINVEGDIAGTVGVQLVKGQSFADSLREYLIGAEDGGGSRYDRRFELFLTSIGGVVADGKLENEGELVDTLAAKLTAFGTFYDLTRIPDKPDYHVSPDTLRATGRHIEGAGREMATIFVRMLAAGLADPSKNARATRDMDPGATTPAADPNWPFEAAALALEMAADPVPDIPFPNIPFPDIPLPDNPFPDIPLPDIPGL